MHLFASCIPQGVFLKGRWRHTRAVAGAVWSLSRVLRRVCYLPRFRWPGGGLFGPFMVLYLGSALWPLEGLGVEPAQCCLLGARHQVWMALPWATCSLTFCGP